MALAKYFTIYVVMFYRLFPFFLSAAETEVLVINYLDKIYSKNDDKGYNPSHHSANVEMKGNATIGDSSYSITSFICIM